MSSESLNAPVRRIVRELFGTVATLAVVGSVDERGIAAAFERLDQIGARFSPYRDDSEISRLRDGRMTLEESDSETRSVLAACEALRLETGGVFDISRAGRDGRLDPSGYVKGWAIGEAHAIIWAAGMENSALGIGGDISARGAGPGGVGWIVGVADPRTPERAVTRVTLRDAAMATSGQTERPGHLRRDGLAALSPYLSVSVVGPSIERVDALATIAYLEGQLDRIVAEGGCEALALLPDGRGITTAGFAALER